MKDRISIIYKFLIVIVTFIGLYLNFQIAPINKMAFYFTIISNVLVLVFYIVDILLYLFAKNYKNKLYYVFKGMIIMMVTMTMMLYWILIGQKNMGIYVDYPMECRFVHLYTPILAIIDYFAFANKGHLKDSFPFIWSLSLIVYVIMVYCYSYFGGTFINDANLPYTFMNVEKNGITKTVFIGLLIYLSYVLIGFIVVKLDKYLGGRNGNKIR